MQYLGIDMAVMERFGLVISICLMALLVALTGNLARESTLFFLMSWLTSTNLELILYQNNIVLIFWKNAWFKYRQRAYPNLTFAS